MKLGGEDLLKQFNRGMDYAQNSFNSSQGIGVNHSLLIYRGIVIEVDFTVFKSTTSSSVQPPFSIYAKIIGLDESTPFPEREAEKTWYPPFFPIHNICIPEIGEEVLIMKEEPNAAAAGYYVGRINDSSPLNISYARDFVGVDDPQTANAFKYGFNFDVRRLRTRYERFMPSDETLNMSIPITFGDVVQQGRSKTYSRHSFNKNNKKGVLEQGIRMEGQLSPNNIANNFNYLTPGDNSGNIVNPTQIETYVNDGDENLTDDDSSQTEVLSKVIITDPNYGLPENVVNATNYDPSIGQTSTKTIHFIDSSIRRLGDYNLQSVANNTESSQTDLNGEDRSIIANISDEIYNISSKETNGVLYRQVLGEKLVAQQRENYNLMREVITAVEGFADSTQTLLDAFLDHTHALPKIELNLEKEFEFKDKIRAPAQFAPQPNANITTRGRYVGGGSATSRVYVGRKKRTWTESQSAWYRRTGGTGKRKTRTWNVPIYKNVTVPIPRTYVPGSSVSIPQPPKLVGAGKIITTKRKQKLNFEAIIGGAENPRFTAPIETDSGDVENPSPLGQKTEVVNTGLLEVIESFSNQKVKLTELNQKISKFLSNNQFIN